MYRAYIDVITANKHYLNPRHALITADFQTYKGVLLQITSRGAARQNSGPLAKASFEHPIEAFVDGATFGKIEEIKNTSTSIFVGKRMILGTGSFKARIDTEALDKAEKIRLEYRENHPELYNFINDEAKNGFVDTLQDETSLYVFNDDESNQHGIYGLDGVDSITRPLDPKFKAATSVQKVILAYLPLPKFIENIINPSIITDTPLITKSPMMSRIGNLKVNTAIGKIGSRAVPRLTPIQLLTSRVGPAPNNNENFDVDDFTDI
jgi:hypothetical protein